MPNLERLMPNNCKPKHHTIALAQMMSERTVPWLTNLYESYSIRQHRLSSLCQGSLSTMAFPKFQSALTAVKEGQYTLNTFYRLPSHSPLSPTYILIRVSFVALNPCNWKMIDFSPAIGTVGGNDFSGRVVATGSAVSKWKIGDSVCGFLYGLDPHVGEGEWAGAFAEYVSVPEGLVMRVVEKKTSMADAACLGAGVVTAGMALRDLGITLTDTALGDLSLRDDASGSIESKKANTRPYILVYGGSTATGTMAIQLARLYDPYTSTEYFRALLKIQIERDTVQ